MLTENTLKHEPTKSAKDRKFLERGPCIKSIAYFRWFRPSSSEREAATQNRNEKPHSVPC